MAQPIVALPKYVVLQSKPQGKYLRYVKEGGEEHGFVKFSADKVSIPEAKFEVEESTTQDGLVHLRSCYSNKYLVFENNWIVATAGQKEEDKTKTLCTLLKPTSVDGNSKQIRLFHVQREKYLWSWKYYAPYVGRVVANYSYSDPISYDVFNVIDWQSLVILPKYVVFKGVGEGNKLHYLRSHWQDNVYYLKFSLDEVENDPEQAGQEIVDNSDGTIRIKSLRTGKFWRRSSNWILPDSTDSNDKDTVFQAVGLGGNRIALRNFGNNMFCTSLSVDWKDNCLNANAIDISTVAELDVSEFTVSSVVEDVQFRLLDATIYGENISTVDTTDVMNNGASEMTQTVTLKGKVSRSYTWNNSFSLNLSVKHKFGFTVEIVKAEVELSAQFSAMLSWGEAKTSEDEITKQVKVAVLPRTKKSVKLVTTKGKCDVPFSYTLTNVYYDGRTERVQMDDGVFRGVNAYNTHVEIGKDIPL